MPRKKKVSVEIVRRPSPTDILALIERKVDERVAEAMSVRDTDQLGPSYLPREIANDLRRRQTMFDRRKWGLWFAKWGCQRCGRKKGLNHASNGNCDACAQLLFRRMAQIKREFDKANPESQIAKDISHLARRLRTAQELLEESPAEATELSHRWAVSAYRKHNVAAGKCAYCPSPLAPNSVHYCVECLGKKREGKRKRREDFKARLHAGQALLGDGE